MRLTAQELRAIRRRRREQAEADAEARFQRDIVGPLFDLVDEMLPSPILIGWIEVTRSAGEDVLCRVCAPTQPTPHHRQVCYGSAFGSRPCRLCGRRLDRLG